MECLWHSYQRSSSIWGLTLENAFLNTQKLEKKNKELYYSLKLNNFLVLLTKLSIPNSFVLIIAA